MATASEGTQLANRSGMSPQRLVVMFILCSGIVLTLFFSHVLGQLWAAVGWVDRPVISGLDWTTSTIIGFVISIALCIGSLAWTPARQLMTESAVELMKVTWPSWGETKNSTVMVIVASVITALFLFSVDTLSYKLMVDWLPGLWGKL